MFLFIKKNIKLFPFLIFFLLFLFSLFVFPVSAQVKDAIAVRVMKNFNHLSPARWYLENVPNPGNPRSIQVDGYEAVRDGRTVYVSAANIDTAGNNIYTNIYIMSYNKDAKESTVKIFNKLVKNWRFNINIDNLRICEFQDADSNNIICSTDFDCVINEVEHGSCIADKSKIRRDVKRLANLEDIKKDLTNYSQKTGFYPGLEQGTYLSRISTSKWPSWQEELSKKLGTNISIDPINRFSGDCDLAGYNSETCWNEIVKDFQCPNDSYLYQYSSLGICSLHCDSAVPANSEFCSNNSDCPCNQGGAGGLAECQGFINQEYCMKSSASAGIALNLESESDPMAYSFNMTVIEAAPDCASSRIYAAVALENINCCEPISCSSLGYDCGIYTNNCGQTITCASVDTDANGVCLAGECVNGFCCVSSCVGKECGDDGCEVSCGICESGYFCDSNFACAPVCADECWPKGRLECSGTFITTDGREQINYCGYYDTDPCLEWSPTPEDCPWPYGCVDDICACWDFDGDGYKNSFCGGEDCNDTNINVNPGIIEICNGIDDNCDENIDEGANWTNLGNVCTAGTGACAKSGVFICNPADLTAPSICSVTEGIPSAEICGNGIDDDCDGSIDENWTNLGNACSAGVGACQESGVFICNPENLTGPSICSAVPSNNQDCSCGASTCQGSTCSDGCGGSCIGTMFCCTPNNCAASTCIGSTCNNGCWISNGTKDCPISYNITKIINYGQYGICSHCGGPIIAPPTPYCFQVLSESGTDVCDAGYTRTLIFSGSVVTRVGNCFTPIPGEGTTTIKYQCDKN